MATQVSPAHANVVEWLEERHGRFYAMANEIWENPELALAEYKASALQAADLEADKFTITKGVGDLPTAFVAEYTHGTGGPIVGFLGEYDALPGLSQERQSGQSPIVMDGPGHGCGHNLLGTAALAAASVTKAWLIATDTAATVRYYGCPAEETCEGKVFMARAGVFDDLDFCLSWHPGINNSPWAGSSNAINNLKFRFKGRTAHAAGNPESGRSALDAVELMNVGVNYLREHAIEKARIHYVITHGGGAPNVVPDDAEVWYFVRAPERHQVEELTERVRKIAAGAAMMTETEVTENFISGAYNLLPNMALTRHMAQVIQELGEIDFTDEEYTYAKEVANQYPEALRVGSLVKRGLPAELADKGLAAGPWPIMDEGETGGGSTDVADVSWITPTGQIRTTCFAIGVPGHSWANTATSGVEIGLKGMMHAAKGMAITAADVISDPELLSAAQAEFKASTAGREYVCPIPPHVQPRTP